MSTDIVSCFCLQCNTELGRFRNSWTRIGNTYYSAEYTIHDNGFEPTGEVRPAGAASQIENSFLQDVVCHKCGKLLGLRCDSAPVGHLLRRNQLILRLSNMSMISEGTGVKADVKITKALPLAVTNGETVTGSKALSMQNALSRPANISEPSRLSDSSLRGYDTENSQINLLRFKTWAEDAINSQQKDIDRISGAVDRIEREMRSLKEMMYEIRDDVVANRQIQVAKQDPSGLRAELEALRDEVRINAQRPMAMVESDRKFVRDTAAEVEELRKELQKLKKSKKNSIGPTRGPQPPVTEPAETSVQYRRHKEGLALQNGSIGRLAKNDAHDGIANRDFHQLQSPIEDSPQSNRQLSDDGYGTTHAEAIATGASGKPRWVYVGARDVPTLKVILPYFGIKYNNTKIIDAINRLELHVRRTGQEDTPHGREYGKLIPAGESTRLSPHSPSRTSLKRSYDDLEAEADADMAARSKKSTWKPETPSGGHNLSAIETNSEPRRQLISLLNDPEADHTYTETGIGKPVSEKKAGKVSVRPGWRRNSDGILINPQGKIDGRSLKFLGKPAANRMRKDRIKKPDGVLPSIERDLENSHQSGTSSRKTSQHVLESQENLDEARMQEEERVKEAEARRREELRAREQLVAQTLESEVE
ncbi:hypothetical protein F5884DRAFT_44267 [Xylogone sp. PMI_703]|nr:hypothetical protein F5884DRAFT_44267 [Xylogone sp. PMI_703]